MGTSIRIHGELSYRNSEALDRALATAQMGIQETIAQYGASLLTPKSITPVERTLVISVNSFATESQSFEAEGVVSLLAESACAGYVDFDFADYPEDGFRIRAKST